LTPLLSAVVLGLLLLCRPSVGLAGYTSQTPRLGAAIDEAWSATPECAELTVADVVADHGAETTFVVASDGSAILVRLTSGERCQSQGSNATCDALICPLLAEPALRSELVAALDRAGPTHPMEQAAQPRDRSQVDVTAMLWLRLAVCLIALFGALALSARPTRVGDSNPRERRQFYSGLAILTVAALVLRSWVAGRLSLRGDEFTSWGLTSIWQEIGSPDLHINPPMYRVLSWPIAALTDAEPATGRLVALVLGAATVWTIGLAGRRLGGGRVGLTAAALAMAHTGLATASAFNRAYAALALFAALTIWATERALAESGERQRFAVAFLVVCTVLSHWFGAAVALGTLVWILVDDRGRMREWFDPVLVGLLLLAPFALLFVEGATAKAALVSDTVGTAHSVDVIRAAPALLLGALAPLLQGSLGGQLSALFAGSFGVALVALLLLAVVFLRGHARRVAIGLSAIVAITLVALSLAPRFISGIREIQAVGAAVAVALLAALLLGRPGRVGVALGVTATLALLVCTLRLTPEPVSSFPPDLLSDWIEAHPEAQPVAVWDWDDYVRVGHNLGLSAAEVDASWRHHDDRARALRSCSSAAVREIGAATLSVARFDGDGMLECDAGRLSGQGVQCTLQSESVEGLTLFQCEVDDDFGGLDVSTVLDGLGER